MDTLSLIGYASGLAGPHLSCGEGPIALRDSPYLLPLIQDGALRWIAMIRPDETANALRLDERVHLVCEALAKQVADCVRNKQFFCVMGGDHTSAIGVWSGAYDVLHTQGDMGLIWIDAHMDSHTPETSLSGRLHGMPLASLLGYGYPTLTTLLHDAPKIKPNHVCLIGVRSFEPGEADLLKRLNVRIFFMEEVKQRGFQAVLRDAVALVTQQTIGYGISLDLDALDPNDIPGVNIPEPDGILVSDLLAGLQAVIADPRLLAMEVAEFDASFDRDHRTEKFIVALLALIAKQRPALYHERGK